MEQSVLPSQRLNAICRSGEVMECRSGGVMECRSGGVMEWWSVGIIKTFIL
jgi:hypothetical protein